MTPFYADPNQEKPPEELSMRFSCRPTPKDISLPAEWRRFLINRNTYESMKDMKSIMKRLAALDTMKYSKKQEDDATVGRLLVLLKELPRESHSVVKNAPSRLLKKALAQL